MDEASPTPDGVPTHRPNGQFAPGNKFGKGNPLAKRQGELRRMFMEAVTPLKMQAVERAIYQATIEGDMQAARVYLEYTIGKPQSMQTEREDTGPLVIEPPLPLTESA